MKVGIAYEFTFNKRTKQNDFTNFQGVHYTSTYYVFKKLNNIDKKWKDRRINEAFDEFHTTVNDRIQMAKATILITVKSNRIEL